MHPWQFCVPAFVSSARALFPVVVLFVLVSPLTAGGELEYSEEERAHWSFQPVHVVAPPDVPDESRPRWGETPIDAFILAGLREQNLRPAAPASPVELIRRMTFDLTGLPPTPQEVDAFTADRAPDAIGRLIDRLLASPHYGERWGQHWLDVVRFAESEGFEYDRHLPSAWMYRDYVIHAFNTDKPYDDFVREQIAGDEMAPPAVVVTAMDDYFSETELERRIAAGFHRLGPVRRNAGNAKVAFSRNEVLTERVDVIGAAFLGLTVGCARCHDHMFDPIRQKDYYRMQAFLASTYAHDVPFADEKYYRQWQARTDDVQAELDRIRDELSQAADEEEVRLKALFEKTKEKLPAPLPTMFSVQNEFDKRTPIHLLDRGDELRKGEPLGMRVLGVLLPEGTPESPADAPHPKRRLADWMTRRDHPLTARVMINRIWQYHFGHGLVETANDFGLNGATPSHPELLDWLANEFVRNGWSVKAMHRLIMQSACYQQSIHSGMADAAERVDAENRLLWRFHRRRLSAEELRDSLLAVSRQLVTQLGGPSVMVPVDEDLTSLLYDPEQWVPSESERAYGRRSVYLIKKRNLRLPFLEVFDQPDLQTSCARRETSTHAPQALELLNGRFANNLAHSFAERLIDECSSDDPLLVDRAFQLTTGKPPTAAQRQLAVDFLREQSVEEFALAMFSLNAFLYVD